MLESTCRHADGLTSSHTVQFVFPMQNWTIAFKCYGVDAFITYFGIFDCINPSGYLKIKYERTNFIILFHRRCTKSHNYRTDNRLINSFVRNKC